jgi:hypothetical protein
VSCYSLAYLDESTKREIKKAIVFFAKSGFVNKEVIYRKLSEDYKVSKIIIMELAVEIAREGEQVVRKALEDDSRS